MTFYDIDQGPSSMGIEEVATVQGSGPKPQTQRLHISYLRSIPYQ